MRRKISNRVVVAVACCVFAAGCGSTAPGDQDDATVTAGDAGIDSGLDGGLDGGVDGGADGGPGPLGLGRMCERNQDCELGQCEPVYAVGITDISLCVLPCTATEPDCPAGASCYVPGAFSGQCLPDCTTGNPPGCVDAEYLGCLHLAVGEQHCVEHPCGVNFCCANDLPCTADADCCTNHCDPVVYTCQTP